MDLNYYEIKKALAKVIPRRRLIKRGMFGKGAIKEKGRKSNYYQFDIIEGKCLKNERLLNTEEIGNFIEVSLRASACPMPLNVDVWDGLTCAYRCRYCYANNFRISLYTSFFDNSKSMGLRHCNVEFYKRELDKLLKNWGTTPKGNAVQRAICKGLPLRFGIRFEDFLPIEGKKKISLELLQYLAKAGYPVMINSKSDLVGRDDYVRALADNPGRAAVHTTLISADNDLLKRLEPGAPSYEKRLGAIRNLAQAGIRPVARIEPYMLFINDEKEMVDKYIEELWEAGCRHITFDTYHYPANSPGIRREFYKQGYDYERMFLLTSDSQPVGSYMLGKYMDLFREKGFSCSTFDLGNVTNNDDYCCCEVGGFFNDRTGTGLNTGSIVSAIRYIKEQEGRAVRWSEYKAWVKTSGGFLSESLESDVHKLWNLTGHTMFSIDWAAGIKSVGWNEDGHIWKYDPEYDRRKEILEAFV
jgi:DNA repair photolyase